MNEAPPVLDFEPVRPQQHNHQYRRAHRHIKPRRRSAIGAGFGGTVGVVIALFVIFTLIPLLLIILMAIAGGLMQ